MENQTFYQTAATEVKTWPLMDTPIQIILIFVTYFMIVKEIGPKLMEKREPYKLLGFIRIYNVFQIVACSAVIINCNVNHNFKLTDTWSCLPMSTDFSNWISYKSAIYWFLLIRIAEFFESFVFVLRNKQNQITFLHIYHHISTPSVVWIHVLYSPCKF